MKTEQGPPYLLNTKAHYDCIFCPWHILKLVDNSNFKFSNLIFQILKLLAYLSQLKNRYILQCDNKTTVIVLWNYNWVLADAKQI